MSGLVLVADDLTGALDSAASFCGRWGPIPVYLGEWPSVAPVHAAVDLATRDGSVQAALQASARVLPRLAAASLAFKKIDSLLRGHWAAELAELVRGDAFDLCVFAPAFPSQGRTMHGARQFVRAADGSRSAVAVEPLSSLQQLGLAVHCATPGELDRFDVAVLAAPTVVVADAASDDELRAIARWGRSLRRRVLWCGSAGLARALAGVDTQRAAAVAAPLLAIVGSAHPVATAQVAHAADRSPRSQVAVGDDIAAAAAQVGQALATGAGCLMTFALAPGLTAGQAAALIDRRLRALLPLLARSASAPPATLLVTGGETLLSVCRALGASHLEVDAELSAGVPHSRLRGGAWDGIAVISKSGAFGGTELLHEVLALAC